MENKCTVKNESISEIDVLKSQFIGIIVPFSDTNSLKETITIYKKKFPKARHYCYAYICGDNQKFSDDGEPSGTAGKPMLEILVRNKLTNVLLIVVRYFGGTLLGSGRLLRTYVQIANDTVEKAEKFELVEKLEVKVEVDQSKLDLFKYYLKNNHFDLVHMEFNDKIQVDFLATRDLDLKELESTFLFKVKVISFNETEVLKSIDGR
jgi:uncharacterized YigZ family protein